VHLKDAAVGSGLVQVAAGLQALTVFLLERGAGGGFVIAGIGREIVGQQDGPDFLAGFACVEQFELGVGEGLGIGLRVRGAEGEALSDELDEPLAESILRRSTSRRSPCSVPKMSCHTAS